MYRTHAHIIKPFPHPQQSFQEFYAIALSTGQTLKSQLKPLILGGVGIALRIGIRTNHFLKAARRAGMRLACESLVYQGF